MITVQMIIHDGNVFCSLILMSIHLSIRSLPLIQFGVVGSLFCDILNFSEHMHLKWASCRGHCGNCKKTAFRSVLSCVSRL